MPEFRRKGLATILTKHAEKITKQKRFYNITGFVQTANKKMRSLKKKLGYKEGGIPLMFHEKKL